MIKMFINMVPSRKVLKDINLLFVSQVVGLISGILTAMLWTNYIEPGIYGQYKVIISIISIVSLLALSGMGVSANLSASKKKGGNFYLIIKYKLIASLISSVFLAAAAALYYSSNRSMFFALMLSSLLLPVWQMTIGKEWLLGCKHFTAVSAIESVQYLAQLGVLFVLIYVYKSSNLVLLTGWMLAVTGSLNVMVMFFVHHSMSADSRNETSHRIMKYGLNYSVASVAGSLLALDNVIIAKSLGYQAVAIYAVARIFPNQVKVFSGVINKMLFPYFSQFNTITSAWKWFRRRIIFAVVCSFVFGGAGFLFIEIAVPILFSQKYADAALYGKWLFLFASLNIVVRFIDNLIASRMKEKYMHITNVFFPLLFLVLLLVLQYFFGLWGVVWAWVLNTVLSGVFTVAALRYYLRRDNVTIPVVVHETSEDFGE